MAGTSGQDEGRIVAGKDYFFIGIDFGTTYTGVAWAYSKRPEVVKVVQWGADGTKFKVPSTIRYHDDGRKIWGFDASPDDVDTLQWFKLLLVEDRDMKENIRNCDYIKKAKASLAKAGKQPQEVVKDYLSLIWTQAVGSICKDMRRVIVDSMPFRVVLTVPATWGEIPYVSQRLVDAAELAGITANRRCGETKLDIASEPEAAAFSTLMDARSDRNLLMGDIFIMCDAGGGTVDLVTYEMQDMDQMKVRECVIGDGGVCGSIFLDQSMEKCVGQWLGRRWTSLTQRERDDFKNEKWRTIKWNFEGSEQPQSARIGQGSVASRLFHSRHKTGAPRTDKNYIVFEKQNLVNIFSPVVDEIVELVGKQIRLTKARERREPKVLILVGGLGGNRYLSKRLGDAYDFDIIQRGGDRPITAICRGAVLKARSLALDPQVNTTMDERVLPAPGVTERIARLSFGVSYFETFDETKHSDADKVYDAPTKKWVASELMFWYVKKGQPVSEIDPPTWTFKRAITTAPPGNRFVVQIWKCNSEAPPSSRRGRNDIVRCTDVLCDVGKPFHELPLCENPAYREIEFQLDFDPRGPMLQFIAKINGEIRGRKDMDMAYF